MVNNSVWVIINNVFRLTAAVVAVVIVIWQTGPVSYRIIPGLLFLLYGTGCLFTGHSTEARSVRFRFLPVLDVFFLGLAFMPSGTALGLLLFFSVQLAVIVLRYGMADILITTVSQLSFFIIQGLVFEKHLPLTSITERYSLLIYFMAAVLIISRAWWSEHRINLARDNLLNKKIENIRDVYEISNLLLRTPEDSYGLKNLIWRLTLDDLEADGGAVFTGYGEEFRLEFSTGIEQVNQKNLSNVQFLKFIGERVRNGKPLVVSGTDQAKNGLHTELRLAELFENYGSILIYPSEIKGVSLVTVHFSKQLRFFTPERVGDYIKKTGKSLFALSRLPEWELLSNNDRQGENKEMLSAVCFLLVRLFRAEKSLIALSGDEGKLTVKGVFGYPDLAPGTLIDCQDRVIAYTWAVNEAVIINDGFTDSPNGFLGHEFGNLLCLPINAGDGIHGIMAVINKQNDDSGYLEGFNMEEKLLLTSLANQIGLTFENKALFKQQKDNFMTTIRSLVQALDARDPYTKGHSEQVAYYAVLIARELGLSEEETENIRFAGLLHDIGKIGIPEKILNKSGKLSIAEYNQVKIHPYISYKILKPIQFLSSLLPYVYHHHERWDGKGYPDGLQGKDIPLGARILAVADSFDAMVTDRVYRKGKIKETAANELIKYAAAQFDPEVVDAFLTAIKKQLFHEKIDADKDFESLSHIFRDVLDAVTSGKLIITDEADITGMRQNGKKLGESNVKNAVDIGIVRMEVKASLQRYNLSDKEINKLLLCVSEVSTNMLKHASGGKISWYLSGNVIRFMADDSGPGLNLGDLPKATLVTHRKTKKALGLGFTVLLEILNKVYLKTGAQGTTLVLEHNLPVIDPENMGEVPAVQARAL